MRDQTEKIESESALHLARLARLARFDTFDDLFECICALLGDMAIILGEPRTIMLDLPYLRSLPGWGR